MKLKAFKIWIYLLPLVAIIGVLLFVQSTNNQSELQQQHIRSVANLSRDIQLALPDYLRRVDAYLIRQGYRESPKPAIKQLADSIQLLREGFKPAVSNLKFQERETLPAPKINLIGNQLLVKDQPVSMPFPNDPNFLNSVNYFSKIKGKRTENSVLTMDLQVPIHALVDLILSNDQIFEKLYVTDSSGVALYPVDDNGRKIFEPKINPEDSTHSMKVGIVSSTIILDGNEFQSYANPIRLGPHKLYFLALLDSDYFLKVGLRINYNLLSTLLFILIMLIASIPILAVVKMGKGDRLTQSRIIQVGISLMTIAVVIGFSISFSKNRPNPSSILESKIKETRIELRSHLARYDSLLKIWKEGMEDLEFGSLNELIKIDPMTGYVEKMNIYSKKETKPLKAVFEKNYSFTYLKDREYVNFFDGKPTVTRFLGSHYSRGTGLLESVIATKIPIPSDSNVYAATFSLDLKADSLNSHRILLIKEDGKVIYKSKKVESSLNNLSESINPNKWKEVKSLMKNNQSLDENVSLHVPLYLNGHQYEAIFNRINSKEFDSNLWQVFLVNSNIFHAFSALTSLEGMILMSFYLAFFLFTLFAQLSTRTRSNSRGFKSFLFEWLVPNAKNLPRITFLIFGYLLFSILLFAILAQTSLNPFRTLAIMTYSSLNISILNLATSQMNTMLKERKISTELLVLLGILLSVYSFLCVFSPVLIVGMSLLSGFTILLILGWAYIRPKKSRLPLQRIFKSTKNALSTYLVFWFFLIGFLPGYLIQSKTQQLEYTIWNAKEIEASEKKDQPKISENENQTTKAEPSPILIGYEQVRRNMMATLGDPFDSKIEDFIAPGQNAIQNAWKGKTTNLSSNPVYYLGFFLLVFATYLVVRWIQNSIFFDFKSEVEVFTESGYAPNYICCINSNQIPLPDEKTETIDLKYRTFPEDFTPNEKYYRLINFHCVENPMTLIKPISEIKNSRSGLTIYSGALWKDIYNGLKSEREKSLFSELFTDFKFSVIQIEDVVKGPFTNEDEVLARLKRNKAFYANIWSDLCFEEKIVCNSYAKEGFYNPARRDTMLDLAQKGIIVPKTYSGSAEGWIEWRLFSPVFRHYILTHSTEEETARFGAYEKKHGNVRTIQTAVISFVLICIAMVGIFDKTFFNEAYTYLTGGLGVLGTLYSFLNQGFAGLSAGKKDS